MKNKFAGCFPVLTFITVIFMYVFFVCPVVYVGDSGELITACYGLGVAHPPGYPLFTLLGKLFTYLPLANIAFRVNIMAALFGALACTAFFTFLAGVFRDKYTLLAFFSAITLALGPVFFSQALQAKGGIYTLNAFLTVLFLLAVRKYSKGKGKMLIYPAGIIFGLALANHHTSLFLLPVMIFFIMKGAKGMKLKDTLVFAGLALFVSALLYLYLPVRASSHPAINWGDPYNWERTLYHIFRGQYGALTANVFSFSRFISETGTFFVIILKEFYLLVPAALAGMYYLLKRNSGFYFPALFLAFSGLLLLLVLNPDMDYKNIETFKVFCVTSFIGISVLVFAGLVYVYERKKVIVFCLLPVLLAPVALSGINTAIAGKTELAGSFNTNLLKTMPKDSLLFCYGDNIMFPLVYLNKVEKLRNDLVIYDDIGCVFTNIYGEDFVKLSDGEKYNVRKKIQLDLVSSFPGRVYFTLGSFLSNSGISSVPAGVLYMTGNGVKPKRPELDSIWASYGDFDKERDIEDYLLKDLAAQYQYFRGEYYLYVNDRANAVKCFLLSAKKAGELDYFTGNISRKLTEAGFYREALDFAGQYENAYTLLNAGITSYKLKKIEDAAGYFEKALSVKPGFAEAYVNLGLVRSETGHPEEAERSLSKGLALDPGNTNALIGLAVLHMKSKKYTLAELELRKALSLDPSNEIALKYLRWLEKEK